ncbi:MAG: hypothetical protein MJ078_02625 [Clostridia bacterium]|nr:hypothetical protein [Clostridia bacterium]
MGKIVNGIYYGTDGLPVHRGIVEENGKLYYAGKNGVLVKNREKHVHHEMTNGLIHHGVYFFNEKGELTSKKPDKQSSFSHAAPERRSREHHSSGHHGTKQKMTFGVWLKKAFRSCCSMLLSPEGIVWLTVGGLVLIAIVLGAFWMNR